MKHWTRRRNSLERAIRQWADDLANGDWGDGGKEPWIGKNTYRRMADAGIAVLRAMRDAERAMAREGVEPIDNED